MKILAIQRIISFALMGYVLDVALRDSSSTIRFVLEVMFFVGLSLYVNALNKKP